MLSTNFRAKKKKKQILQKNFPPKKKKKKKKKKGRNRTLRKEFANGGNNIKECLDVFRVDGIARYDAKEVFGELLWN
jgi:hypothetical protein